MGNVARVDTGWLGVCDSGQLDRTQEFPRAVLICLLCFLVSYLDHCVDEMEQVHLPELWREIFS